VKYVERESASGAAGIQRGWQIVKINNNVNIDASSNTSIDYIIQNVFSSTNTTFTFKLPDGSTKEIALTANTYQEHPIFLDTVYNNVGGKNVGYIVSIHSSAIPPKSGMNLIAYLTASPVQV
jgi:hypothetical protein